MTYGEIYKMFLKDTNIPESDIDDYRPCSATYDVPNIKNAIVIWLKTGRRIIYIAE